MVEEAEMRGLRNIVKSSLEGLGEPGSVPPLMNFDGSYVSMEELEEIGATIRAAREAVNG